MIILGKPNQDATLPLTTRSNTPDSGASSAVPTANTSAPSPPTPPTSGTTLALEIRWQFGERIENPAQLTGFNDRELELIYRHAQTDEGMAIALGNALKAIRSFVDQNPNFTPYQAIPEGWRPNVRSVGQSLRNWLTKKRT